MSIENNKATVRKLVDATNRQDYAIIAQHMTPSAAEQYTQLCQWIHTNLAGHIAEITDIMAEGDKVWTRLNTSGTHSGEVEGIASTGKRWNNRGLYFWRFEGNNVAEAEGFFDDLNFLQQLGATLTKPNTAQDNQRLLRRWLDVFKSGDLAIADELFTPDYIFHDADGTITPNGRGPDVAKAIVQFWRNAFSDVEFIIQDFMCDGDKVMTRWIAQGTHRGTLFDVAPTNKLVRTHGIGIDRIVNGRIAETWSNADMVGLLQKLGVIPNLS